MKSAFFLLNSCVNSRSQPACRLHAVIARTSQRTCWWISLSEAPETPCPALFRIAANAVKTFCACCSTLLPMESTPSPKRLWPALQTKPKKSYSNNTCHIPFYLFIPFIFHFFLLLFAFVFIYCIIEFDFLFVSLNAITVPLSSGPICIINLH